MTEKIETSGYVLVDSCVYCADLRGTGTSATVFIAGVERLVFTLLVPEIVKDEVINFFAHSISSTKVSGVLDRRSCECVSTSHEKWIR